MNPEQAANYLTAVLSTAVVGVIIPLAILGFLLGGLRAIVRDAAQNPEGFLGRMLCDDAGKPSSDRLAKMVAVVITMWMGAVVVFSQPQLVIEAMSVLMVGWGGVDLSKHWISSKYAAAPQAPQQPPVQP